MKYLIVALILFAARVNGQYPVSAQYMWNLGYVREKGSEKEVYKYYMMEINSNATFELRVCSIPKGATNVFFDPLASGIVRAKGDTLSLIDTLGIKSGVFRHVLAEKKILFVQEKEAGHLISSDSLLAGNHFYQSMYFYQTGQKWQYGNRDPQGRKNLTWTIYARDGTVIRKIVYDHGVVIKEQ